MLNETNIPARAATATEKIVFSLILNSFNARFQQRASMFTFNLD
ncbi:hypothetical protein PCLA_07f0402 [Pseudomonas citronellolis]|nr:hypothetical protein PCLA_07f0402 [Pseudomonas citronellolis]